MADCAVARRHLAADGWLVTVQLTWHEQFLAAQVGLLRYFRAVRDRRLDGHGLSVSNGDGIAFHINGAMGEMAFAKSEQLYWDGSVDTFKRPDVGGIYVRTRSRPEYELLIREDDPDNAPFVLVRGQEGCYDIVGWMWSQEAKQPSWQHDYGNREPAWFVPDRYLQPIDTLPLKRR